MFTVSGPNMDECTLRVEAYRSANFKQIYIIAVDTQPNLLEPWAKKQAGDIRPPQLTVLDLFYVDEKSTGAETRIISQVAQRHGAAQFHTVSEIRVMLGVGVVELVNTRYSHIRRIVCVNLQPWQYDIYNISEHWPPRTTTSTIPTPTQEETTTSSGITN